ncbi:hypothetical protein CDD81_5649 [Ophiocordyceps australis]|uniref:Protein kinase domain-containing protein n=1 Tax=Ophiocordyceps australis TaxID=1399860 RepID=A0A2C5XIB4_9HYPO|nr:hypothetical protein CDD81_5649 [Ophiocordyceps australis]
MTSYVFRSALAASASAASSSGDGSCQTSLSASHGSFAAFVCHAAHLQDKLRSEESVFADPDSLWTASRSSIGQGSSFMVEKVQVGEREGNKARLWRHKAVVVKTVRQHGLDAPSWRGILLEMRVLLHEPIRYHPNIVRLLDISCDAPSHSASPFPALVQEWAEFGTLAALQQGLGDALAFGIKQKLCYDVSRGLSILHACGIVHGDLKHENVLVFVNRYAQPAGQPYTAKVADFGGTVLQTTRDTSSAVPMLTFPYEAPEIDERLTGDAAKKTDVFSYGMLVWRCMLDGNDVLAAMGFLLPHGRPSMQQRRELKRLKQTDGLLEAALCTLARHVSTRSLPQESLGLAMSVLMLTLSGDASKRALDRAQARLRGMSSRDAHDYVIVKDIANAQLERNRKDATRGIDVDGVGYALGRSAGDDYDAQNNLPGFRPDLPQPDSGGAVFEPAKLRRLLDWTQQQDMVRGFEAAAKDQVAELPSSSAALFLFESHLTGFGVVQSPSEACRWLRVAAAAKEQRESVECRASAWVVRIHQALGEPNPQSLAEQVEVLCWAATWGHVRCGDEARRVMAAARLEEREEAWGGMVEEAERKCRALTSGTGMPIFIARRLTRKWDTQSVAEMDLLVEQELGSAYPSSLRKKGQESLESQESQIHESREGQESQESQTLETGEGQESPLDGIRVNNKGHGLVHLVASQGNLAMLTHLHRTYTCNINLANQSHADSPLTCACRTGHLACALYLLTHGAHPNGPPFAQEAPLHCLAAFSPSDLPLAAAALLSAGADIERATNAARKDVRAIWADWEDDASICTTPLGRAVLQQSVAAVRELLAWGASPWQERDGEGRAVVQPVVLAAVLTLPHILQLLLDAQPAEETRFDEEDMLRVARGGQATPYDSLSLLSRLVRCGARYKKDLAQTLAILRTRAASTTASPSHVPGAQLCREIELGNADIVDTLLGLGHAPLGSPRHQPLVAAVAMNDLPTLRLLLRHGAALSSVEEPLLVVLASRPQSTPPGIALAQFLLDNGVDADAAHANGPSALALAIRNRFFDLADLLIPRCNPSAINAPCVWPGTRAPDSLLGCLVASHSFSHLQSLEHLAAAHASPSTPLAVLPQTASSSALHRLAQLPASAWNSHSQVSDRILHLVLAMFPQPHSLRELHVDDRLGTPLTAAIMAANHHVLTTLLHSPYRADCHTSVRVQYSLFGAQAAHATTAPALALKLALDALDSASQPASPSPSPLIPELETRVEIATELNPASRELLAARLETCRAAMYPPCLPHPLSDNMPVDLSIISEEKPTAWRQGDDAMTDQDATRTFLNALRRTEGIGHPVTVAMDQAFNKRPLEQSQQETSCE